VRPTELPGPGPSYAELYAEGAFAQRRFIDAGKLRDLAQARRIRLPLFPRRDVLEPLDAHGALAPIAFRQTNYSAETTWLHPDPRELMWREERHAEPWEAFAWDPPWRGDPGIVSECYSPWQMLYLRDAIEGLDVAVNARSLIDARRLEREMDGLRSQAEVRLTRWGALDEAWRPFVKLLIALQPRFWPYRSGRTTLLHDSGTSPPAEVDPLEYAHETFDATQMLERFELAVDDLAWLHYHVASDARRLDPVGHLHTLLDAAPRKRTDLMTGDALQARDLYDAAYLLRGLYYLVTGERLPTPDQLDNEHTVEEWERRHLPRPEQPSPRSRLDLKDLLIREGLYPHLIHFFVEGETEEIVLTLLLPFLGYGAESGMTVTNIRGIDKAERYGVLFAAANEYAARTVIVADLEGEIERTLRRLRQAGVFTDEGDVLLWEIDGTPSSFEEANFSLDEILVAIQSTATDRAPDARLTLTPNVLRAEFERRVDAASAKGKPRPGLANLALELASQVEHGAIRASKKELAGRFARILEDAVRDAEHLAKAGKTRPLLTRLWYWIANTR
jgi:hypothetical protein